VTTRFFLQISKSVRFDGWRLYTNLDSERLAKCNCDVSTEAIFTCPRSRRCATVTVPFAMVRCQCDRLRPRGSAVYSRDTVRLFEQIRVQAETESAPVLLRPNGTAPQIMRGRPGEAEFGCILFHYVPDQPFSDPSTPAFSGTTGTSKDRAAGQACCRSPEIECTLHPVWYRHRSNVPALPNEINDGPVFFPLL
jgi:hypothetical protein